MKKLNFVKLGKQQWKSVILSVLIVALCNFLVSIYPSFIRTSYRDMSSYVSTTIEYANGERSCLKGTEFGPINKGDRITMEVSLPIEEVIDPAILTFGVNHAVTQISFDDMILASYGEDIAARGDFICHHNYFVDIPEEAWGRTITVSIRATEDKAFNRISRFWLYPAGEAYHFYFDLEFGRMAVSLSVMIISIMTLMATPLLMQQGKRRTLKLLFMALFGIVSASWMMLAEGLQEFFGIESKLITTFEYVTFTAQVIPMAGFVLIEETDKKKKQLLHGLILIDAVFVVLICILNYSNIAHFSVTLATSTAFIAINGIIFVWNSMRKMNFSIPSKRASLLGVSVLCLTAIFDVVRFNLYRYIGTASFNHTQKTFPLGVLFFYIFLLISAIISGQEQQEEERHNRSKLLASQIQPHFLYNTLASIRELIFENPQYAADTLFDFTTYLRGAVRAMSDVQIIPFSEELKNIKAYAEIEKMRMPERLQVNYEIEASEFVVPPLSIQPLVENAIRHGIYKRGKDGGSVTVRSFEQENNWVIEISDTGIGFDVKTVMEQSKSKEGNSVGLMNVMTRLREISHATVSIHSIPDKGTSVVVTIPKSDSMKLKIWEYN